MAPRTQFGPRSMLRSGAGVRVSERESVSSGFAKRGGERLKTHLDLWHPVPSLGLGACCPPGPGYGVPNVRVLAPATRLGPGNVENASGLMAPRTQSGPRSMLRPGARVRGSERESVSSGQATRAGKLSEDG